MSEIVRSVLKIAFGFISNTIRTYGSEKLQDGGLTDQLFRKLIVRELDDIKSKLDANARKHLFASISCLVQGVERLHMSHDESVKSGNASTSESPEDGKQSQDTTNAGATSSTETKPAQNSVTVEDAIALATAIGKLKIESSERFESARKSFEEAGKQARLAFHDTSLTTEERILATKVRIASGLLEHLDDLELATSDCLQYLRELHGMSATKEIFSVHLHGGVKSFFKKDSRLEIVETVTMINLVLADFISKFTKRRMGVFDWPMIECAERVVHPIYYEEKSLPNLKEMNNKITPPWDIVLLKENLHYIAAIFNSKGDLICFCEERPGLQRLDTTTGELQPYCLSPLKDNTEHSESAYSGDMALAVNEDDTVYVLSREGDYITLSIYSADGRNTHHCILKFLQNFALLNLCVAVTKDKNIVICCRKDNDIHVYLCDSNGELIKNFDAGLKDHCLNSVFVSCNNEILLATQKLEKGSNVFYMYTNDGQFKKAVKLRSSDGYHWRISYDQVTETTSDVRYDVQSVKLMSYFLSYGTDEVPDLYSLHHTNFPFDILRNFELVSQITNGPLALVDSKRVIFLRKSSQSSQ